MKLEEGAASPGIQVATRSWKRQGIIFFPGSSLRNQPCWHLDFSPLRLILMQMTNKHMKICSLIIKEMQIHSISFLDRLVNFSLTYISLFCLFIHWSMDTYCEWGGARRALWAGEGPDLTQVFTESLWLHVGNRLWAQSRTGEHREETDAMVQLGEGGAREGVSNGPMQHILSSSVNGTY